MTTPPLPPPPLLDLLGASWPQGAPVIGVAWDSGDEIVGFALGDGDVALVKGRWPGGPRLEPRQTGGVAWVAADREAPAPFRVACHRGSCLALRADRPGGFLSGGDDGRLVRVPLAGTPVVALEQPGAWFDLVASSASGRHAFAIGRRVHRQQVVIGPAPTGRSPATRITTGPPEPEPAVRHDVLDPGYDVLDLAVPATALAFSPDEQTLAIAHPGGVTLWAQASTPRQLHWKGYHRALAWSPDGRYLVSAMQENALHGWRVADGSDLEMGGYPGQPLSLSFAHDGRYLATSGGAQPVCWAFEFPWTEDQPVVCGQANKTPVTQVACHPAQSLIAAGHHNGAVLLCQPGVAEGLLIKGAGGGAVNALAWSGDGSRLAFGTQDGLIGWLLLPEVLFRSRERAPASTPQPRKETTP